jgi:hypothetical protein
LKKSRCLISLIVIIILLVVSGCGISGNSELSTSKEEGWHKTAGKTTGQDWYIMTHYQKEDIVKGIIKTWEDNGHIVTEDADWFINNLDAFYDDEVTQDMNLAEAMSMLAVSGNVFKDDQEKIEKSMSTITEYEKKIWQYCMDRWEYYDIIEGEYSGDKYTDNVFQDAVNEFGMTSQEIKTVWEKVDRASYGLE